MFRLRPNWPSFLQPGATSFAGPAEETSSEGNKHCFFIFLFIVYSL